MQSTRCRIDLVLALIFTVTNKEVTKNVASFYFFGIIANRMAFFIATMINDLGDISEFFLLLFIITYGCGWSSISSNWNGVITLLLIFSITTLVHLFSFSLLRRLLGLKTLFSLISLILIFEGYTRYLSLFRLVVLGIKTHLQRSICLRTVLIQVGIPLNLGFDL